MTIGTSKRNDLPAPGMPHAITLASIALESRLIVHCMPLNCTGEQVARWCFEVADAMLVEAVKQIQTESEGD